MTDDHNEYLKRLTEREKEETHWPYPVRRIRRKEAEHVSLMLAGLREEYQVPLIIVTDLDLMRDFGTGRIIPEKMQLRHYHPFCKYLQEEIPGGQSFCRRSTIKNISQCLKEFRPTGDNLFVKECLFGLKNCYAPLFFDDNPEVPIAYFAFGKFCTIEDITIIEGKINLLKKEIPSITSEQLEKLRSNIAGIKTRKDNDVELIKNEVRKGIAKIKEILQGNYEKNKRLYFRRFRDQMEVDLFKTFQQLEHSQDIFNNKDILKFLQTLCKYFRTQYVAIFLAKSPQANILEMVAQNGLDDVKKNEVQCNWKKADIKPEDIGAVDWENYLPDVDKLKQGLRGIKKGKLFNPAYMFPFGLADHCGMVVLGPFTHQVRIEQEKEFLNRLCYAIGLRLGALQVLKTISDKEEQKKRAITIPAHTVCHGLNNVLAEITALGKLVKKDYFKDQALKTNIERILERARTGINFLAQFSTFALEDTGVNRGLTLELQKDHLLQEELSPYALIDECVPIFQERAREAGRRIIIEEQSLEELPGIKVDPSVMKLALSLLLENAIKYTAVGKYIKIWGERTPRGVEEVKIHLSNVGLEIKENEKEDIFKIDIRGEAAQKNLPTQKGYGLGLPQVKKIIELHGGKIYVECSKKGPGAWDHLVVFTITLPTLFAQEIGMIK